MDDATGDSGPALEEVHRAALLVIYRYMLATTQGRKIVIAPDMTREDVIGLCELLASRAASEAAGQLQAARNLSAAEARAESAAHLEDLIMDLELASLGDGTVPFPGGQALPESAMPDGALMDMPPAEVRASRRVWGYVADVAVEDGHPRLPPAELAEIAEGLAGLVLGLIAGTHAAARFGAGGGGEAAAWYVRSQRELYWSLDAGGSVA